MKSIKLQINFSNWHKFVPYVFYLVEPARGRIYPVMIKGDFKGYYVRFKALIQIGKELRPVDLSLPKYQVENAFKGLPVPAKNCKLLKVAFEKQDEGRLAIKEFEVVK